MACLFLQQLHSVLLRPYENNGRQAYSSGKVKGGDETHDDDDDDLPYYTDGQERGWREKRERDKQSVQRATEENCLKRACDSRPSAVSVTCGRG